MWFTFFQLVFKRPALDSIRRLKANIVLSNQGLGWELFTFTSALSRRFAVRPGCYCSLLGGFACLFGAGSFDQPSSVLFKIKAKVWVVGWRKWDCAKSCDHYSVATMKSDVFDMQGWAGNKKQAWNLFSNLMHQIHQTDRTNQQIFN